MVEKNGFIKLWLHLIKGMKYKVEIIFLGQVLQLYTKPLVKRVSKEVLSAKYFSATTDMWSSVGINLSFTVHFVDCDLKLQSRCLQTAFMPKDHTADNLSAALSDVLDAGQLSSAKQVAIITTDNGSNIV